MEIRGANCGSCFTTVAGADAAAAGSSVPTWPSLQPSELLLSSSIDSASGAEALHDISVPKCKAPQNVSTDMGRTPPRLHDTEIVENRTAPTQGVNNAHASTETQRQSSRAQPPDHTHTLG